MQDVADRVVQRSLLDVLMSESGVEEAVKTPASFGGVPGRGVDDAIKPVVDLIRSGAAKYFIRSDIRDFFAAMPRAPALAQLTDLLPDDSLNDFLQVATQTELSNHRELGHLLDFFPNEHTGVPQGHALSALLGNILLREFDQAINTGGTHGIRYLDDFLILATSKADAHQAFRRGRKILDLLELTCYLPRKGGKAAEGKATQLFEFLGCEIASGFVRPSRKNRRALLRRVEERLQSSATAMTAGTFGSPSSYSDSVAATVGGLSRMLRGWSEQYSFCNYSQIQRDMDQKIDEMLSSYLGTYSNRRRRSDTTMSRRMLGVWLLQDSEEGSLW